jgi:hypothetical protein
VEAGDLLISLNEDTNYLVQMKTDSIRRLSLTERNQVTEHYADARAAVEFRPIIVPMACRRVDEDPIAKSARRRSRKDPHGARRPCGAHSSHRVVVSRLSRVRL